MQRIPAGALLTVPPDIMVSFFSGKDIEKLVSAEGLTLNGLEKIEILETTTIHACQPDFQRHHEKRIGSTSEEAQNLGTGKRRHDVGQVHAARLLDGHDCRSQSS